MYTLGTAAKATGVSKSTLSRALKDGTISGRKQPDGSYEIDPAELHRVYPPVQSPTGSEEHQSNDTQPLKMDDETGGLRAEIQVLRERLANVERMGEVEKAALMERIEELKADRADLKTERDKLLRVIEDQAGSVKLLTDQSQKVATPSVTSGRGGSGGGGQEVS